MTSFEIAGRDRGFGTKERKSIDLAVGRAYREAIRSFAEMRTLDLWYARIDVEAIQARFAEDASMNGSG